MWIYKQVRKVWLQNFEGDGSRTIKYVVRASN